MCFGEKIHMSKWIQTDSKYPWTVYVFETFVNKGLRQCVEKCSARKQCEYINFEVKTNVCYLIGIKATETGILNGVAERIQTKKGYAFGKKREWKLVRNCYFLYLKLFICVKRKTPPTNR